MQRRDFLKTGLAAGGAALAAGCGGQGAGEPAARPQDTATASPSGDWNLPPFEHEEATLASLQEAMSAGRLTSKALTQAYFDRMDAVDSGGPRINSVIERNPEALAIAESLDRERHDKGSRGPLHGVPVLIKDNIDTADRMHTSAGSLALADSIAPADAGLVARLRAAGAVILGKANLSEWANFRSTRSTSGWSGRGRQTLNPYVLDRTPCGSSSGSAAAAAANLCAAAIGTETDGSIICPSKSCSLVGIKPTVGLVSRGGVIPISASQDTAGPIARCVADAAILLGGMTGPDPRDPVTARSAGHVASDYTAFLQPGALKGARLGVMRSTFGHNAMLHKVMDEALAELSRQGAELVDPVEFAHVDDIDQAEGTVLRYEFKHGINAYLASLGPDAPCKDLADLIAFNEQHRDREMPWFGQEIFLKCVDLGPLTSKEYLDAVRTIHRLAAVEGIDGVMDRLKLDAVIGPSGDPPATIDLVNGDHHTGGGASTLAAVTGYPHVTVPAGQVYGLPVGLSFFGRAWSEPKLIALAYAFEQATHRRQPPTFLRTAALPA